MQVLVVTNMYPIASAPNYGIWVAEQVRSLRAAGVEVDVFFFNPKRTRLNYGLCVPALARTLRSKAYDLVHTHHSYSLMTVNLARFVAGVRTPVVLTNHEAEATDPKARTRTWHPTSHLRHSVRFKRYAAQRADFVIYVSKELASKITSNGRYTIIPCGVDLDKFSPGDPRTCRERLGIPPHSTVLFFPSEPANFRKRFALAKAAYRIVRQSRPDTILLAAGGIEYGSMPLYYNAADVVIQTSYCEASPTVVKEALACEVPLVSTNTGDTREIVEGVPCCQVVGEDPEELASGILSCVGRRAVGGRDRLRALGLGLDQVAERVIGVYKHVLISGSQVGAGATP